MRFLLFPANCGVYIDKVVTSSQNHPSCSSDNLTTCDLACNKSEANCFNSGGDISFCSFISYNVINGHCLAINRSRERERVNKECSMFNKRELSI